MVEFGLKLQDNKVSDWSEHYIEYEKLKAILKKAGNAVKRLDDLSKQNNEKTKRIIDNYRKGLATPHHSQTNLSSYSEQDDDNNIKEQVKAQAQSIADALQQEEAAFSSSTVTQPLLTTTTTTTTTTTQSSNTTADNNGTTTKSGGDYGSTATISISDAASSSTSLRRVDSKGNLLSRAFQTASSNVTDYFQRSWERTVRDVLKEIDGCASDFAQCLESNIDTVNEFYDQKLNELEGRISYLKESVAQIRSGPHPPPPPSSSEEQQLHVLDEDMEKNTTTTNTDDNIVKDDLETPLWTAKKKKKKVGDLARTVVQSLRRRPRSNTTPALLSSPSLSPTKTNLLLEGGGDDDEDNTDEHQHPTGYHHQESDQSAGDVMTDEERALKFREVESIQRALVDHYRTAKLLHNFAIMNYTGFVKIVKKYNKTMPKTFKNRHKHAIVPGKICKEGVEVEKLANRMEMLYANWFCDRNINEARAQMLTKKGDGLEMDWSQLRLGYRMGMCSILGLWICWDCIWGLVHQGHSTIGGRTAFPVFRACGGLLMLQWCWGFSVWVWTRYRVNYIYLFDFNPDIVASPLAIFNEAVDNTLTYLVFALLYYKAGAHDIPEIFPPGVYPLLLVIYTVYQFVFPLRARGPMWLSIWHLVTAPMTSPNFFHGYVGDIFTSLVKVFQDLAWTLFFVFSGDWLISEDRKASTKHLWSRTTLYSHILIPLLTLLPLWFRFNQCLRRYADTGKRMPHLANAFKYALSQTVTLFGAFHPLYMRAEKNDNGLFQAFWMFAFVASSLYSFCWDVFMDWGLGQLKNQFLSQRLMYPRKAMYYGIICIDLVLRFAWVLTLIPPQSGAKFAVPAYLSFLSMMLEIFRRTIWGFLRLENEHRSNTAGFRRVNFVPLHFSTGHKHGYKHEQEHRGFSVLIEVTVVTVIVLGAAVISVIAAQRATERVNKSQGEL